MGRAIGSEGALAGERRNSSNTKRATRGNWLVWLAADETTSPSKKRNLSNFDYAKAKLIAHIFGKLDCANTPLPGSKSMALRVIHG